MSARSAIENILAKADIRIGGERPWDIKVTNEDIYARVARYGSLGAGEAYMEGWWDCAAIDQMICKLSRAHLDDSFSSSGLASAALKLYQSLFNLQNRVKSFEVGRKHYDFGNDMFAWMLGPSMNYSCGYWREAKNLDEAQRAKMDLICRKLKLEPGMTVLDIGCGWGALALYMAEKRGARVTGISISAQQIAYARERDKEGLASWILDDYRSLEGKFDRIVSVGMFEHVGYKNYRSFMRECQRLLVPDGLFLLHTIGSNYQRKGTDPWIDKYIFPNGMLPSQVNLTQAFVDFFIMEDWQNFGADYDKTLMAWAERFRKGYEEGRFECGKEQARMFLYYLLTCAGSFRARDMQLWQLVLSPAGVPGGYLSER